MGIRMTLQFVDASGGAIHFPAQEHTLGTAAVKILTAYPCLAATMLTALTLTADGIRFRLRRHEQSSHPLTAA
jgi:hypothetical protein